MSGRDSLVQLFAGATGGTLGAVITCPLEVVKTRLQSSQHAAERMYASGNVAFRGFGSGVSYSQLISPALHQARLGSPTAAAASSTSCCCPAVTTVTQPAGLVRSLFAIVEREGVLALFKGLGPNLVGVAPSRAIYFCAYQNAKLFFNQRLPVDSSGVHVAAAVTGGITTSTVANPIWLVKTRLQLDRQQFGHRLKVSQCIASIYASQGVRGFYKGVSASYYGVVETVIHFVIYEKLKQCLDARRLDTSLRVSDGRNIGGGRAGTDTGTTPTQPVRTGRHFVEFMLAAAFSKTIASTVAYPHEVARTRLREDGAKYLRFFQTLRLVWLEEGWRGWYSGLGIQLLRQIPNTAILMATYEACVYFLTDNRTA